MSTARDRGEHGHTVYAQGCRCAVCTDAMRAYFRDYFAARALLRGRTPLWMVDARPVAAHLARLTASGWTYRKIAAEAGCSPQTLANLVHRARRRGEARCWNITARGVLALRART